MSADSPKKLDLTAKMIVIGESVKGNASQTDRPPVFLVKPEITQSGLIEGAVEGEPAGFFIRLAAHVFDSGLVFAAASFVAPILIEKVPEFAEMKQSILSLAGAGLLFAYLMGALVVGKGATLGKKILDLKVSGPSDQNGGQVGLLRAFGRCFAFFVFPLGAVTALFLKSKKAIHDLIVSTQVVRGPRTSAPLGLVLFFVGNASMWWFFMMPTVFNAKEKIEDKIAQAEKPEIAKATTPAPEGAPAAVPAAAPVAPEVTPKAWSPEQLAELKKVFRTMVVDQSATAAKTPETKKAARAECMARKVSAGYSPKMLEVLKQGDNPKFLETLTPAEYAELETMPRAMMEIGIKCAVEVR